VSVVKSLVAASVAAFAAPLLVIGATPPAAAACPANKVGKLDTVYDPSGSYFGQEEVVTWYMSDDALTQDVGMSSDIVLDVALWPFPKGQNRFTLEAPSGHDFIEMDLEGGQVAVEAATADGGAYYRDVMTYEPNSWNNLRIRFDLDGAVAHIKLNDQSYDLESSAGSQIGQLWWHDSYDAPAKDTTSGYMDNLSLTKVKDGERTTYFSEDFEDGQVTGPPSLSVVDATYDMAEGSGCAQPPVLTVDQRQTSDRITVFGGVQPAAPGWDVQVKLFEKKAGRFVQVGKARRVTLDHASSYKASFPQPAGARKCRTTVHFEGTPSISEDTVSRTFGC
jgi:hypothetical protein